MRLYYIHDPMCSWCWAFSPTLTALTKALPTHIGLYKLLGGLAPDTNQPMPTAMREQIRATWRHIQTSVPGTRFNFDFWDHCQPRRSTWAACRAVLIAAESGLGDSMNSAIQHAYYLQARNPSDDTVLIDLANALGLNTQSFAAALNSKPVHAQLQAQMQHCRNLGVDSYPSLVLRSGNDHWPVAVNYQHADTMLATINALIACSASPCRTTARS